MPVKPVAEPTGVDRTIDTDMRAFIVESARRNIGSAAIRDELHDLGFPWVRNVDVSAVIEEALTSFYRDVDEVISARAERDPEFRAALAEEAVKCDDEGDAETAAALRDYLKVERE